MPVCLLLLFSAICGLVSGIFGCLWIWNSPSNEFDLIRVFEEDKSEFWPTTYHVNEFFFTLYFGADMVVHGLFVLKYWIASRKLHMCLQGKIDPRFQLKATILSVTLITWSVASITAWGIVYWDPSKWIKRLGKPKWLLAFISDGPAIAFFVLLAWAFLTMKSFKSEYTLSHNQVLIQLSFNFAYAVVNLFPFVFYQFSATFCWLTLLAVAVNAASLVVLTHTLCQICDMQLLHEQNENARFSDFTQSIQESNPHESLTESLKSTIREELNLSVLSIEEATLMRHAMPNKKRTNSSYF